MSSVRTKGLSLSVSRALFDPKSYRLEIYKESVTSVLELEEIIPAAKVEDLICQLLTEIGLTKKVQKALKPLLVDASHEQAAS